MKKIFYSTEKTNAWRPTPWSFSSEPFPAFRGEGQSHRAFLAVAKNYSPLFLGQPTSDGYNCPKECFDTALTKLIKTKEKGTLLLVPCSAEENEQIMLITLRGAFRGGYARIDAVGCEVFFQETSSKHCVVTGHMIVRLTHPNGYVFAETGDCNRSSRGLIEIFSWDGYKTMPTEDFETWRELHHPDMSEKAFADGKAKAESDRKVAVQKAQELQLKDEAEAIAKAEAERVSGEMRPALQPRLEQVSKRLKVLGLSEIYFYDKSFYAFGCHYEYTEQNFYRIEKELLEREAKFNELKIKREAVMPRLETLIPRAEALGISISFSKEDFRIGNGYSQSYSEENLLKAEETILQKEIEKVEAEKAAAWAIEYAEKSVEAVAQGLPSNISIWKRRRGATNAGDGWVIRPDGTFRQPDEMDCPRPRYEDEGHQIWKQILVGEVCLSWAKAYTAAEHEFEVLYQPEELTPAQLRTIAILEEEIAIEWDGKTGFASGIPSPPVGGWFLKNFSWEDSHKVEESQEKKPITLDDLQRLREKFGKT